MKWPASGDVETHHKSWAHSTQVVDVVASHGIGDSCHAIAITHSLRCKGSSIDWPWTVGLEEHIQVLITRLLQLMSSGRGKLTICAQSHRGKNLTQKFKENWC